MLTLAQTRALDTWMAAPGVARFPVDPLTWISPDATAVNRTSPESNAMQEGSQSARPPGPFEDFTPRHSVRIRPSTALIASLTALTLFVLVGIRRQAPLIEQDIRERATAAFSDAGIAWAQIVVDGRDITVFGVAPSAAARSAAYRIAADLEGVRLARNRTALRAVRTGPDP